MRASLLFIFISLSIYANGQNPNEPGGENWRISNGLIQPKGSPKDTLALKYWNYLNDKLPSALLKQYVHSLRLFSDGEEEALGGMSPLNDVNSKWEIDIDTLDFDFKNKEVSHINNYVHTIIHEFGHLLTLNPEQVKITEDVFQNDEKGYLTSEGYATPSSYLGKFVDSFWNDGLLRKWDKIDKINSNRRKLRLLYKFYWKNEYQFLTDYAAESPEEDIAESWTFFVLSDRPILDEVKYRKVLFFYQFPELVTYRKDIRDKLQSIPPNYIEKYKQDFEEGK